MEAILAEQKQWESVVSEAKDLLVGILERFKTRQKEIGADLIVAFREMMKKESTVGKCLCGKELVTRTSHKAHKRFVGCTGYPGCTQTFSLPQKGFLKITPEKCLQCGLFVLMIKSFRGRPWYLCIRDGFVSAKGEKQEPRPPKEPGAKEESEAVVNEEPAIEVDLE